VLSTLNRYTIITQRLKRRLDTWSKDNSGAAAVEFAMIAAPFFFIIFGLLEIAIIFIVSTTLEHGLNEATRQIRTGSLQNNTPDFTRAEFVQAVCGELLGLLECDSSKIDVDVRTFGNFGTSNFSNGLDGDGNFSNVGFQFNPGGRNEIVLARVYYEWELITPVISAPLQNLSNGNRLITASIAFRNEPF